MSAVSVRVLADVEHLHVLRDWRRVLGEQRRVDDRRSGKVPQGVSVTVQVGSEMKSYESFYALMRKLVNAGLSADEAWDAVFRGVDEEISRLSSSSFTHAASVGPEGPAHFDTVDSSDDTADEAAETWAAMDASPEPTVELSDHDADEAGETWAAMDATMEQTADSSDHAAGAAGETGAAMDATSEPTSDASDHAAGAAGTAAGVTSGQTSGIVRGIVVTRIDQLPPRFIGNRSFTSIGAALRERGDEENVFILPDASPQELPPIESAQKLTLVGCDANGVELESSGAVIISSESIVKSASVECRGLRFTNRVHLQGGQGRVHNCSFANGGVDVQGGKWSFENCTIEKSATSGITVSGESDVTMTSCHLSGSTHHGAEVRDSAKARFSRCTLSGNVLCGVLVNDAASAELLDKCVVSGNTQDGVRTLGKAIVSMQSCAIFENQCGVSVNGQSFCALESCQVTENREDGVRASSATSMHRCRLIGNGQSGVSVSCRRFEGRSCTVSQNRNGIELKAESRSTFEDCYVNDNSECGLVVDSTAEVTSEGCTVMSNRYENVPELNLPSVRAQEAVFAETFDHERNFKGDSGAFVDLLKTISEKMRQSDRNAQWSLCRAAERLASYILLYASASELDEAVLALTEMICGRRSEHVSHLARQYENPFSARDRNVREMPFFSLPSSCRSDIVRHRRDLEQCAFVRCGDCSFVIASTREQLSALEKIVSSIRRVQRDQAQDVHFLVMTVEEQLVRALEARAKESPNDDARRTLLRRAKSPMSLKLFGHEFPELFGVLALRDFVPFSLSQRPHFAAECIRRRLMSGQGGETLLSLNDSLSIAHPEDALLANYHRSSILARELDALFDQREKYISAADMRRLFQAQRASRVKMRSS
jgi:parallel beta-helix repeat protein